MEATLVYHRLVENRHSDKVTAAIFITCGPAAATGGYQWWVNFQVSVCWRALYEVGDITRCHVDLGRNLKVSLRDSDGG